MAKLEINEIVSDRFIRRFDEATEAEKDYILQIFDEDQNIADSWVRWQGFDFSDSYYHEEISENYYGKLVIDVSHLSLNEFTGKRTHGYDLVQMYKLEMEDNFGEVPEWASPFFSATDYETLTEILENLGIFFDDVNGIVWQG